MNSFKKYGHFLKQIVTLFVCIFFVLSCYKKHTKVKVVKPKVQLIAANNIITAGEALEIKYSTLTSLKGFKLFIKNSLNTSIVLPKFVNDQMVFNIPETFIKKAGRLDYTLTFKKEKLDEGVINIKPLPKTKTIETYLGPNYITTLENEYAMLVSIPLDKYDNINRNKLKVKKTIRGNSTVFNHKNLEYVNYDRIFSMQKKGKIYLITIDKDTISKKKEIAVRASYATDFQIAYNRNNQLADGKEITEIKTSVITDKYGNIIENGSLVTFVINEEKNTYYGYATTINGIATFKKVHPSLPKKISIQAFVDGFSKSNKIKLGYYNYE